MEESLGSQIMTYHEASKHHYRSFAPGPGYLDWATQPDPFRRYAGARVIPLAHPESHDGPPYEAGFRPGLTPVAPLDLASVSRLFFDALAISAWKEHAGERWALRVNPSSGNLHPTEGYLICGAMPGLCEMPIVAHYAPAVHALEMRARLNDNVWRSLREGVALNKGDGLPEETILIGLTSILWREAWKYGDRAFRYCQHDVGHALAALDIAAAGLGWQARLLDELSTEQLETLLGVTDLHEAEREHADCLVAIYPQSARCRQWRLPEGILDFFRPLAWQGQSNVLSSSHVEWRWAETAAEITRKSADSRWPVTESGWLGSATSGAPDSGSAGQLAPSLPLLRRIIRQRRSAQEMDGVTHIEADVFYRILARTVPRHDRFPFAMLPWSPRVHIAIFVHRVTGLAPGIYFLARDPAQVGALVAALKPEFMWETPPDCPADLPLYRLAAGDMRSIARRISCGQDIAADGCFSLGMLAEFEPPLNEHGAWIYPRLFWECGMIGQVLYLEAESAGIRGTGIGCFFDDGMHSFLGLHDRRFQDLYHFTVGGLVDDPRLTTLPAYEGQKQHRVEGGRS